MAADHEEAQEIAERKLGAPAAIESAGAGGGAVIDRDDGPHYLVHLEVPAQPKHIRLVRLLAAGLASQLDFFL